MVSGGVRGRNQLAAFANVNNTSGYGAGTRLILEAVHHCRQLSEDEGTLDKCAGAGSVRTDGLSDIRTFKRAVVRDTGCYLCEVNTEPFSTIYAFYLNVQEPTPPVASNHKKGTRLMANMAGDEVLLNCTISFAGEQGEDDVIWTRDGKMINLNNTDKYIWKVKRSAGVIVHTVRIRQATMEDDGDYACESRHQRASQIVHVNKAEAQHSTSPSRIVLFSQFSHFCNDRFFAFYDIDFASFFLSAQLNVIVGEQIEFHMLMSAVRIWAKTSSDEIESFIELYKVSTMPPFPEGFNNS